MQTFALLVLIEWFSCCSVLIQVTAVEVKCDHTTPVCECNAPAEDNYCDFKFTIEYHYTFTRYEVTKHRISRGIAGNVWYIDATTGEFKSHPTPDGSSTCRDITEDSDECTEAFAVDGYTFRSFIAVNGRIPGPTIIVGVDKTVRVNVTNELPSETTSIHWHGMHQKDNPWMDGVERITQCGITSGTSFQYEFVASPAGTHWYHSHSGAQRTDGLFGTFIVREDSATFSAVHDTLGTYDDQPGEHSLSLLDWQVKNSIDLFTQLNAGIRFFDQEQAPEVNTKVIERTYSVDGSEIGPVSYWSGLINGRGRQSKVPYIKTRLSVFKVDHGKTYRFRLIGAQSLYAFKVSIDEHEMTLIAMDGVFVRPKTFDYIIIHSGERYDFLLKTKSRSETATHYNFMIRAETLEKKFDNHEAEAILHYGNKDSVPTSAQYEEIANNSNRVDTTCTEKSKCRVFNCPFESYPSSYNITCTHVHEMRTILPTADTYLPDIVVSEEDKVLLNLGFEGNRQTSAINGRNMKLPSTAPVVATGKVKTAVQSEFCSKLDDRSVCGNLDAAYKPECSCVHVKEIKGDRSIQLVFSAVGPNSTDTSNFLATHPVHLHGHYFHVVDIQFGDYDSNSGNLVQGNEDIDCGDPENISLCNVPKWKNDYANNKEGKVDPYSPLKDTVILPAGGYVVAYIKSNNPGYWFLHCHIEVHQLEGMGVIIAENVNKMKTPPSVFKDYCGSGSDKLSSFTLLMLFFISIFYYSIV